MLMGKPPFSEPRSAYTRVSNLWRLKRRGVLVSDALSIIAVPAMGVLIFQS
jgi:hypothetical protein